MIAVIIFYGLITLTCVWAGNLCHRLLAGFVSPGNLQASAKHWIVYAFWGLIGITLLAQIFELFLPLNQYSWLAILALLALGTAFEKTVFAAFMVWLKRLRRLEPVLLLVCAAMVGLFAVLSAGPILMDDTESYHIQMIKWIQEYGTVVGLANLHERYGFNSSWFTLAGLFIPRNNPHNFFTILNGTLSVWFSIYLFTNFWKCVKAQDSSKDTATYLSSFVILMIALFSWPMLRGNATNLNYDFITACMIVVLFMELLRENDREWKRFLPELLVWPVFLFTVRIINSPVLLLSFFALTVLIGDQRFKLLILCSVASLALTLPFLARNVLLSGYLFYPIYQVNLFDVDWKADPGLTRNLVSYIKYFNRVNAGIQPIAETEKLYFPRWIPLWLYHLFSYDKLLLAISVAGYLAVWLKMKVVKQLNPAARLFIGVMGIQIFSWFWIAPDPRFAYGPLLTGSFMLSFLLLKNHAGSISATGQLVNRLALTLALAVIGFTVVKVCMDVRYRNLFLPAQVPVPESRVIEIDHIQFTIPGKLPGNWNPRCCSLSIPCLYTIRPGLRARGKNIGDGFKLMK
jgi:hypothetical protein